MKEIYTAEYGAGGPSEAEGKPAWPNEAGQLKDTFELSAYCLSTETEGGRCPVAGVYKAPVTTTCQIACEQSCPTTEGTVVAGRRLSGSEDVGLTTAPTPAPTGGAPTVKP